MKKRLFIITLCIILVLLPITIHAEKPSEKSLLNDYVGLLSESEGATIEARLNEVSEKIKADIVVLILPETYGMSSRQCATRYFEEEGYGKDKENGGVIFLFVTDGTESAGSRDSAIEVFDNCMKKIDADTVYDDIADSFYENDYLNGFLGFANSCARQMAFPLLKNLAVSLAIGAIVALIVVLVMKSKLKTVRAQRGAMQYTRQGSLNVTRSREIYLYSTVSRVRRQTDSNRSGGGGSGGSSHTGSSRRL